LRLLSSRLDVHCQGLAQAARKARASQLICGKTSQRLVRLDYAYNIVRHATRPRNSSFYAALLDELNQASMPSLASATASPASSFRSCSSARSCGASRGLARVARYRLDSGDTDLDEINYYPDVPAAEEVPPRDNACADALSSSTRSPSVTSRPSSPAAEAAVEMDGEVYGALGGEGVKPSQRSPSAASGSSSPAAEVAYEMNGEGHGARDDERVQPSQRSREDFGEMFENLLNNYSKVARGNMHDIVRKNLQCGEPPCALRAQYIGCYLDMPVLQRDFPGGLPVWAREMAEQRATRDFEFFLLPEASAGSFPGAANVRKPQPACGSGSSTAGGLNGNPGFGHGPRRSRKRR